MPKKKKKKNNKTIKAGVKGKRDKAVRSMTSSMASGATSVANSTINKKMRKSRSKKINRGSAIVSMASSMGSEMGSMGMSIGKSLGRSAYDTGMPMIKEAASSMRKSVSKFASEQRIPRVMNNPSWEDLRRALSKGLINIGILDKGETIPTSIYFQSVENFLDTHKGKLINKEKIRRVKATFRGIHPDNTGDATPQIMKDIFKDGITHDSLMSVLEYGFQADLSHNMDEQIPEQSSVPGHGFKKAKEKTSANNKYREVISLAAGIEIFMESDDKDKYYGGVAHKRFKKLEGLVTTEEELTILQKLIEKYPELDSLAATKKKRRKKKSKGKAHKKTGRKKR